MEWAGAAGAWNLCLEGRRPRIPGREPVIPVRGRLRAPYTPPYGSRILADSNLQLYKEWAGAAGTGNPGREGPYASI